MRKYKLYCVFCGKPSDNLEEKDILNQYKNDGFNCLCDKCETKWSKKVLKSNRKDENRIT